MAAWEHEAGAVQGARARQEDEYGVFALPPELEAGDLLLVLADGMGGQRAGARASALAVHRFIDAYDRVSAAAIPDRLAQALGQVNAAMAQEVASDPDGLDGMGCTLLAVVLAEEGLYWVSVGDSALWLWRRSALQRLNQDHAYRSVLAEQVSKGELSATEAACHPDRNALLSAITGTEPELVDLPRQAYPLEAADEVLLASDGLLTLTEAEIAAVLKRTQVAGRPCQRLLSAVTRRRHPYQDNTTVLWARAAALQPAASWWWYRWRGRTRAAASSGQ